MGQELTIQAIKLRRCLRKMPREAFKCFVAPIFNGGQALTFAAAVIGLALYLQRATPSERDLQAEQWAIQVQAFGLALVGWAVISFIIAPFLVVRSDRQMGQWHGRRFVYNVPYLAATFRCKATGRPQLHDFKFDHAEPASFVYYRIEIQGNPPTHLYSATVTSPKSIILSLYTEPSRGASSGGLKIADDGAAKLLIVMKSEMISHTVRVYALDFNVGNDLGDTDGNEGQEFKVSGSNGSY